MTAFHAPIAWRISAILRFAVGVAVLGYVITYRTPPFGNSAPDYLVPVSVLVAGGLIFLAAVQSFTKRKPSPLTTLMFLVADLLAPILILLLFSFDPDNNLFVFFLVAMVQSALALRLVGALIAWVSLSVAFALIALNAEELSGTPADPGVVASGIVLMLLVAFVAERLTHNMDKMLLASDEMAGMNAQDRMIERFSSSYDSRSSERPERVDRVARLTEGTALGLGLAPDEAAFMARASLLHHVGDVAVPDEIWNKAGSLTPVEIEQVRRHSTIGSELLGQGDSPLLKLAEEIANAHHERWDGAGFTGLKGNEIPLGARIVAVADAFEAMTHDRPYRTARSAEEAFAELQAEAGKQFDPAVVEAFITFARQGKVG